MANKTTHQVIAALSAGAFIANKEAHEGKQTLTPLGGAALAAFCTNLPDKLEPAIHPHHRQFFHSVSFALLIVGGMYRLNQWSPQTEGEKLLKFCMNVAGAAYLTHLAVDACTRRSLPLLGKV